MSRLLAALLPILLTAPASAADSPLAGRVEDFLREAAKTYDEEVRIEVGRIQDNPRYAACTRWEASLPPGQKARGRVTVALNCAEGTRASLFVSALVRVFGSYVVMARPVQGGQQLMAEDVRLERGEVSVQPSDVLLRTEDAVGQRTRQALAARQSLRALHLQLVPAVSAGQTVRLLAQGKGFAVSYEGQALNSAGAGQPVRVRTAGGKIVSGTARADGAVVLNAE